MADFMSVSNEIRYAAKQHHHRHVKPLQKELDTLTFAQSFRSSWKTALTEPVDGWPVGQYAVAKAEKSADPLERAIRAEYRQLRLSSIECYNLDLSFWPATTSNPHFHGGCSDVKFYNFTQAPSPPHVIPVQIVVGLKEELHVLVKFNREWQPFTKFLQTLINHSVPASYPLLRGLWEENGKAFPLFELPAEVRNNVYEFAMAPKPSGVAPRVHPYRYGMFQQRGRTHTSLRPNMALLLASRQIHKEAAYILYIFPTFVFQRLCHLETFFGQIGRTNRQCLRYLELNFTQKELLKMFGANLSLYHSWNPSPASTVLKILQLHKLELTLPPPVDMVKHDWLWGETSGCQIKVVDWILGFARPYIQHLPVELDGYIKRTQKERFLQGIKYYKDYSAEAHHNKLELTRDTEDGGVALDHDETSDIPVTENGDSSDADSEDSESDDDEGTDTEDGISTYQLPPVCKCKTRCTVDSFTFED